MMGLPQLIEATLKVTKTPTDEVLLALFKRISSGQRSVRIGLIFGWKRRQLVLPAPNQVKSWMLV